MKAKKKFGQNFLKNEIILKKIVQTIPNNNYHIVEIGSGLGDLTKYLLQLSDVTSFEIDRDLDELLKNKFSTEINNGKLELINKDVLKCWNSNLYDKSYNLVANLPYNVATKIILKALKDINCKTLIVLIQKEVACKFCAYPNDRAFSSLSVLAQSVANTEILFDISPDNFDPVPKVNSSVIRIQKHSIDDQKIVDVKFEHFLKICFMQPRKTISKNLSQAISKEYVLSALKQYEIPNTHRPHQIDTNKYHLLYKTLKENFDKK